MLEIRRREVIAGLGGAAAWPLTARAQQGDRVRRIGVLMPFDESDPEAKLRYSAFTQALAGLGWTDGRNVRIDLRWRSADNNRIRAPTSKLRWQASGLNCSRRLRSRRSWSACNPT
jgi:putative ABC transport system substrate-binding protein